MNTLAVIRNLKWSGLGIILAWLILYFFFPAGLLLLVGLAIFYLVVGVYNLWKKQMPNATITLLISAFLTGTALYFWKHRPSIDIFWTMGTLTGLMVILVFVLWRTHK